MSALLSISRLIDSINERIGKSVIWLIFAAILIAAVNAVVRKVFSISSNAWLEAQWYLYGTAFMLAASYTLKENEHIRIDIFYGTRSQRTRHWIDLFGHVFFLLPFVVLMAWMLIPYAWSAWNSGQGSANSGGLLIWPARLALAFGFVMLVFQAVSEIIKKIAIMRGLIEDPHPFVSAHEAAEQEGAELASTVTRLGTEEKQ